jgi:hypothetical protein
MPIYYTFIAIPTLHPRNSTPKLQISNTSCYKSSSSPNTPPNPFEETPRKHTHTHTHTYQTFLTICPLSHPIRPKPFLLQIFCHPIHSTKSSNTAESSCYKSSPNSLHQKVPTLQNLLVTNPHPIHSTKKFQHCRIFLLQILTQFTPPKSSNTAESSCYKSSPNSLQTFIP